MCFVCICGVLWKFVTTNAFIPIHLTRSHLAVFVVAVVKSTENAFQLKCTMCFIGTFVDCAFGLFACLLPFRRRRRVDIGNSAQWLEMLARQIDTKYLVRPNESDGRGSSLETMRVAIVVERSG